MPRKKEKTKVNSIAGTQKTIDRLQTKLSSPIELTPDEQIVFDDVIAGLPNDLWEPYRLRLAANLAKKIIYAERLQAQLEEEGPTHIQPTGNLVNNPIQGAVQQVYGSITSLTRTLGLSASQRGVSETKMAPAKSAEKQAKEIIQKASKSDLLG